MTPTERKLAYRDLRKTEKSIVVYRRLRRDARRKEQFARALGHDAEIARLSADAKDLRRQLGLLTEDAHGSP